jgi:hypothetical protein
MARARTDESDRLAEQARRMRLALEQHMLKVQRLNSESGMMVTPAPPRLSSHLPPPPHGALTGASEAPGGPAHHRQAARDVLRARAER